MLITNNIVTKPWQYIYPHKTTYRKYSYIEMVESEFKTRYNHTQAQFKRPTFHVPNLMQMISKSNKQDFSHLHQIRHMRSSRTFELGNTLFFQNTFAWQLKENQSDYTSGRRIPVATQSAIYVLRREAFHFKTDKKFLLNKQVQLISKCRHENKFLTLS